MAGGVFLSNAVVLLSGGLDSATVLAVARSYGFSVHALSFCYGQRHGLEVACARRVARAGSAVRHIVTDIDPRLFTNSALTTKEGLHKDRSISAIGRGIPASYVPARNTLFLSLALSYAENIGCADIFIGVNALDYSGYPDCRPRYISAFEAMANLATRVGVEGGDRITIHTPLIDMTKAEIVRLGCDLGVDYSITSSCYDPTADAQACGRCDSCVLRLRGFEEAGIADPISYAFPVSAKQASPKRD